MKEVVILDRDEFENLKEILNRMSQRLTLALSGNHIYTGQILAVQDLVNEMKDILLND